MRKSSPKSKYRVAGRARAHVCMCSVISCDSARRIRARGIIHELIRDTQTSPNTHTHTRQAYRHMQARTRVGASNLHINVSVYRHRNALFGVAAASAATAPTGVFSEVFVRVRACRLISAAAADAVRVLCATRRLTLCARLSRTASEFATHRLFAFASTRACSSREATSRSRTTHIHTHTNDPRMTNK